MSRFFKWFRSTIFLHQNTICTSPCPHTCYMPRPTHSSWSDHPNNIWWGAQIIKLPFKPQLVKLHVVQTTATQNMENVYFYQLLRLHPRRHLAGVTPVYRHDIKPINSV
jgi:hypothetical protein